MYAVETDAEVVEQITALPTSALPPYAELMALLEIAPWSGESYNRQRPDANVRSHPFGTNGEGLAIYLILDDQRRVIVLRVLWAAWPTAT